MLLTSLRGKGSRARHITNLLTSNNSEDTCGSTWPSSYRTESSLKKLPRSNKRQTCTSYQRTSSTLSSWSVPVTAVLIWALKPSQSSSIFPVPRRIYPMPSSQVLTVTFFRLFLHLPITFYRAPENFSVAPVDWLGGTEEVQCGNCGSNC